ncbi:MAG: arylesterase [Gammaproteobacteria bacterium]
MVRWGLLLLLVFSSHAHADKIACAPDDAPAEVVLIVGDSLSAGYGIDRSEAWATHLQERFEKKAAPYRVVNASISGDTTSGGLARLKKALPKHRPALVVIELGGNDGLRGLPIRVMRKNLTGMIEASRAAGAQVALLGMRIPSNYGARYTDAFYKVYGDLARDYELPLVEFFLEGVALDPDLMQSDGIHPNASAQMRLLDNAWPAIAQGLVSHCAAD